MRENVENDCVLVYTTWPDTASAEAAGRALVEERLAACINILAPATAIYAWQGAIERDTEHPMLIKTRRGCVAGALALIRRVHPYDVPAAAVLEMTGGNPDFLAWIGAQTASDVPASGDDGAHDAGQ